MLSAVAFFVVAFLVVVFFSTFFSTFSAFGASILAAIAFNSSAVYTLTCFLSLPSLSNLTVPVTFAYKVSSLPMPTFYPGWNFVPLCLTRMFPAGTT